MRALIRFDRRYFLIALGLFVALAAIAMAVRTGPVRTHLRDEGVILLLYAALRSAVSVRIRTGVLITVGLACLVEPSQALDVLDRLGLADVPLAQVTAGTTFDWLDIAMYALGGAIVMVAESAVRRRP